MIIGAGPAGLGAAYRLRELGVEDFVVLEASDHVGGLATSYRDEQNFTWDIGGHVQFSHYSYFDAVMDRALGGDGWNHLDRESWVWIRRGSCRTLFRAISDTCRRATSLAACWASLRNRLRPSRTPPTNFRDWIQQSFGCRHRIGLHGALQPQGLGLSSRHALARVGQRRVASVDLTRILSNIVFRRDDVSWGPNNRFRFPKSGVPEPSGNGWPTCAVASGPPRL